MKKLLCSALILLLATSNAFTSADEKPRGPGTWSTWFVKVILKNSPPKQYTMSSRDIRTVGDMKQHLKKEFGTTGRISVVENSKIIYLDDSTPADSHLITGNEPTFIDDKLTQNQIELEWADASKGTMSFYRSDFSGKTFGDLLEAVRQKEGAKGGKLQGINKDVVSDLDESQKIPFGFFTLNKIRYAGGTRVGRETPDKGGTWFVRVKLKDSPVKQYTMSSSDIRTVGDMKQHLKKEFGTTGRISVVENNKIIYLDDSTPVGSPLIIGNELTFWDDRGSQKEIELEWADASKGTMLFNLSDFSGKTFGDLLEAVRQKEGAKGGKLQGINKDVVSDLDESQKIPLGFFDLNKIRYTGGTRVGRETPGKD